MMTVSPCCCMRCGVVMVLSAGVVVVPLTGVAAVVVLPSVAARSAAAKMPAMK